jgi:hypothetical protein
LILIPMGITHDGSVATSHIKAIATKIPPQP